MSQDAKSGDKKGAKTSNPKGQVKKASVYQPEESKGPQVI